MAKVGKSDLLVGAFVLLGLLLAALVIFLIGDERRVFDRSRAYHAAFDDVEGLKPGAPIRMGGVRIGQVEGVGYSEDAGDGKVHVHLDIVADAADRLRADSTVSIENKGLLGDKMVVVTQGTEGDVVAPGSHLPTKKSPGMFARIDDMAAEAESTLQDVSKLAEALGDEKLHEDIQGTADSVNKMMKELTEGEGYPQRLLTSRQEADRISGLVDNLDTTSRELSATLREVRLAVRQVRTGPGFAHDMLYGEGAKKEVAQIGAAADEVALTLRGVREGNGFAH
ncbi:MAG: MlaD family protein, partial [Myxococcota bacterium]